MEALETVSKESPMPNATLINERSQTSSAQTGDSRDLLNRNRKIHLRPTINDKFTMSVKSTQSFL